jgi:phosphoribosylamine--glycine ligase
MNILLIGSGGREHALALKIAESKSLNKLYCAPGNPGIGLIAENVQIDISDHSTVINFCNINQIDLVIVGPEKPLTDGIADALTSNNILVFGPSKSAARIEGEKSFAKNLMKKYNVPTADFRIFHKNQKNEALSYLQKVTYPIVIKADGIAAGKGVIIAQDFDEANLGIIECFDSSSFGAAGDTVVIEEFMEGVEASIFAVCDGNDFVLLPAAQDHKRIFDGDKGKNTGGMGAYSPTPFVTDEILEETAQIVIKPVLKALADNGSPFIGCLYAGLMLTKEGIKVVEFNCRFGDPETQVVMPLIDGDFAELLYSAAKRKIIKDLVRYNGGAAICVVLASKGYPEKYEKGKEIIIKSELDPSTNVIHAGTKLIGDKLVTDGGRVLNVVSKINQNDLRDCKKRVYEEISKIYFDGMQYRTDISDKAFNLNQEAN